MALSPSKAVKAMAAPAANPSPIPLVGIGVSALDNQAILEFFQPLGADNGLAFVVVPRAHPMDPSAIAEIVGAATSMPVLEARHGMLIEPDHVYVLAPCSPMTIADGVFRPLPRPTAAATTSIDAFLSALAEDQRHRAVGVLLAGAGSEGRRGLRDIKSAGGLSFLQENGDSANADGNVDYVLPPAAIAAELQRLSKTGYFANHLDETPAAELPESDEFAAIIRLLSRSSGVDFNHYKSATLWRRVQRMMSARNLPSLKDYLEILRNDPHELHALFQETLIQVTSFFRDPEVFEALRKTVLPQLLKDRTEGPPIRIWVPGCSSGEEAYSLLMELTEFLDENVFYGPVKLFATDISERALTSARAGLYPGSIACEVSPKRLARFFRKVNGGYQIAKTLRAQCIFSRHDMTRDPPFSRLDLLSCRNVLIYLNSILQKRVLPVFHYALKPAGALVLGLSESVGAFADLFEVADKKLKIYQRTPQVSRLHLDFMPERQAQPSAAQAAIRPDTPLAPIEIQREADRVVLARYAPAGVIVDEKLTVVQFRGHTGVCLQSAPGNPTLDLLQLARQGLFTDLYETFDKASRENVAVRKEGVRVQTNSHSQVFNLEVAPLALPTSRKRYFLVLFEDARTIVRTAPVPLFAENHSTAMHETIHLNQELEATRSYLQAVITDKEAANEDLSAANEEIVSSNAELQSANEELETTKEELQAVNEELTTVNDELEVRIAQSSELNDDLVNLIESVNIPTVVLEADLCLRRVTPSASRVLGLLPTDIGRPLLDLTLKFKIENLSALIHEVLETLAPKRIEVADSRGVWYRLNINPYRRDGNQIDGAVLTFFDIDVAKRHERQVVHAYQNAANILGTIREPFVILDASLKVKTANPAFYETFKVMPAETEEQPLYELGQRQWDIPDLRKLLEEILPEQRQINDYEVQHTFPKIGDRTMLLNAHRIIPREGGEAAQIFLTIVDITERKRAEERFRIVVESAPNAHVMARQDGRIVLVNAQTEKMFGYSREELLNQPVELLVPERFRAGHPGQRADFFVAPVRRAMGMGRDLYGRRKDGSEFPVEIALNPIETQEGLMVLSAIVDITERKRAQETIQSSEAMLKRAQAIAQLGSYEIHFPPSAQDYFSDEIWHIVGVAPQPVVSLAAFIQSFFHEDDRANVTQWLEQTLRNGQPGNFEARMLHADGSSRWVYCIGEPTLDADGNIVKLVGILHDITQRKRAEEALREGDARLRALVESAVDAIITMNEHGIIESYNPGGERIFGYSAGEVIGHQFTMLLEVPRQDDSNTFLQRLLKKFRNDVSSAEQELRGRCKNGLIFPLEMTISRIGDFPLFTAIVRDVTRRKELEKEVIEISAQEQLRIGQELHDGLGQEVTGLSMMAGALAERLPEETREGKLSSRIRIGLERLHEQVRSLSRGLLISELGREGLRAALEDFVQRTVEQTEVICRFECPRSIIVEDRGVAKQLYRIAQEAVSNALRHGQARSITIGLKQDNHAITMSIKDDGHGISGKTNLEQGMGIRIMNYRAGLIGGTVKIGPADGSGTIVICTLPKET